MLIRIGVENNFDGRSLAWALDFPGCAAPGTNGPEAVLRLPQRLLFYAHRIAARIDDPWGQVGDFDLRVVETFEGFWVNPAKERVPAGTPDCYEVNAFFEDDRRPLDADEIEHGLAMMRWNREDLLQIASGLDAETLDRQHPGEHWPVRGILRHVGNSEWWYLDRLGLGGLLRAELPDDVFERMAFARHQMESVLPRLEGRADLVVERSGELWSPRKVLRFAIWHEIDHIEHIIRLITA